MKERSVSVLVSSAPSAVNVSAKIELRLGGKLFSHKTIILPGGRPVICSNSTCHPGF